MKNILCESLSILVNNIKYSPVSMILIELVNDTNELFVILPRFNKLKNMHYSLTCILKSPVIKKLPDATLRNKAEI